MKHEFSRHIYSPDGGYPMVTFYPTEGRVFVLLGNRRAWVTGVTKHSEAIANRCIELAEQVATSSGPIPSVSYEKAKK